MARLTRREMTMGLVAAGAAAAVPLPAYALSESQARSLIETTVSEINRVISAGKPLNAMLRDFERLFRKFGDTSYIAAYVLGADGRRASSAQKKAFSDAFVGYIARKYGRRFNAFKGARYEVKSVKRVKNYYQVKTTAHLRGQAPFATDWLVSDRGGKSQFFNLYVEGVNMLLTERAEVGAMLDKRRGDLNALIADLKKAG
ncbi:MAG: ABC transporter substrate-binding protein [Pelagimonas sp.]|nr:ABC transporter substrate-binding protein [Pelagimonas sp.]